MRPLRAAKRCWCMTLARVYVIDDSSEMRQSLHHLLKAMGVSSWPFASGRDFLEQLEGITPAPVLLDVRMPDVDGIEVMQELRARGIDWPVVIMTGHAEVPLAVKAMKLGAVDLLEKPFDPDVLEAVLTHAQDVIARKGDARDRSAAARAALDQLTRREAQVVDLVATGATNKAVAHQLGISIRTAEMHRANAMAKLGVGKVAELMKLIAAAGDAASDAGGR